MKTEHWHFLDTAAHDAAWNMACDEVLLRRKSEVRNSKSEIDSPTLRVYGWKRPAISVGYFQKWSPELANGVSHVGNAARDRDLVRRPTGGGLVEHGDGFTYSIILPKSHDLAALPTLELYRQIHGAVRKALRTVGTESTLNAQLPTPNSQRRNAIAKCFVVPTCYDLVTDGHKIAGAAIRKTKDGVLVQGEVKANLSTSALQRAIEVQFDAQFEKLILPVTLRNKIEQLAIEKYASEVWTKKFVGHAIA